MRTICTLLLLFALGTGCGSPPQVPERSAMPVEYFVQREIGRQLRLMLADTISPWDSASSHQLVSSYLAAVDEFDNRFFSMIGAGIPPSPPCPACDDIRYLVAAPGADWGALQVLSKEKEPLLGFRLIEEGEAGALIEPDVEDGKELPEEGFLRIPHGEELMDIAMKFTR